VVLDGGAAFLFLLPANICVVYPREAMRRFSFLLLVAGISQVGLTFIVDVLVDDEEAERSVKTIAVFSAIFYFLASIFAFVSNQKINPESEEANDKPEDEEVAEP